MRTAIWQYYAEDLRIEPVEIDVTKGDTKSIWDKLQKSLPLYSLFQSDRKIATQTARFKTLSAKL